MNISSNIKLLRTLKGMSQKQLSKATGIPRHNIGAYEEGRSEPPLHIVCKLSEYFEVTMDKLVKEKIKVVIKE